MGTLTPLVLVRSGTRTLDLLQDCVYLPFLPNILTIYLYFNVWRGDLCKLSAYS